jgi:hypothetical protein
VRFDGTVIRDRDKCNRHRELVGLPPLPSLPPSQPLDATQPKPERIKRACCRPSGPGSELKALLGELGVTGCKMGCNGRAAQMDRWGIAGCRENRETICGWITEQKNAASLLTQATVVANLIRTGLVLRIHSVGDLVDEAIRRAEAKQCECMPDG